MYQTVNVKELFQWSDKGVVAAELKSESYREPATGRREKRTSGTKPYEESKFPMTENRRKPSTVGAASGRGQGQICSITHLDGDLVYSE